MFGTDILFITFLFIVIESLLLVSLLTTYWISIYDKSRLRILILTFLFILYNFTSGLMPNENIELSLLLQNSLAYASGIILASYTFYFLTKELKIYSTLKINTKKLLISLLVLFVLSFGGVYFVHGNLDFTKNVFLVGASIIAVYYCVQTIIHLLKTLKDSSRDTIPTKTMIIAGNFSIFFISTMPIVAFFDNMQELNHTLVNMSLFFILYAYYKFLYFESKKRNILIDNFLEKEFNLEIFFQSHNFSEKEQEIALLLLSDMNFKQIAEKLTKADSAIRKHASNFYLKIGCSNKSEFIEIIKQVSKK